MKNLFIAIGIGIMVGLVDMIPMMIQKLDKYATIS